MSQPSIILTGFMGTGKSTIGRLLAEKLEFEFVDSDDQIEQTTGRSIGEIFEREGEDYFRRLEQAFARNYARSHDKVIATGGGMMVNPLNAVLLGQNNVVFCLTAAPDVIISRLKEDAIFRPLLAGPDPEGELDRLLSEREEAYSQFSQFDTSDMAPDLVVDAIVQQYQQVAGARSLENQATGKINVSYPGGSYPVVVGQYLLATLEQSLSDRERTIIISDENVAPLHAYKLDNLDPLDVIVIPAGEEYKNLDTVRMIYGRLLAAGADRKTTVVALGGGVVGDVAGFAAATYMRGLPFVQCPTTVLSMVDASIGAKTGVDLPEGKNLVGAFKQPRAVFAELDTLTTLDQAEVSAGFAEIVKHGLIASEALLARLEQNKTLINFPGESDSGGVGDLGDLLSVIVEAILIKRDVVESDPYELGRRRILNLGHTFAHAIEQVSGYSIRHGEAVAIGLVASANLSIHLGYAQESLQERLEAILKRFNLPIRLPKAMLPGDIIQAMSSDKKKDRDNLHFVLIREIGDVFVTDRVTGSNVLHTLRTLRQG